MYDYIKIEKQQRIAVLTLNRPDKLNAIDLQLKREIHRALDELEADNDVRVVIMTGAGRAFSSGHDMNAPRSELPEFESLEEEERLLTFDKPIIAAIHGYALGDALQQAVLCDTAGRSHMLRSCLVTPPDSRLEKGQRITTYLRPDKRRRSIQNRSSEQSSAP